MAHFSFNLSSNIILGHYSIEKIGIETAKFGKKVLFVAESSLHESGIAKKIIDILENHGISVLFFDGVAQTARTDVIERALTLARGAFVDAVIGIGGVWAASVGRTVAALYNTEGSLYQYLDGNTASTNPIPFIQIHTACADPFAFTSSSPVVDARDKKIHILKFEQDICKLSIFDPACYADDTNNVLTQNILQGITTAFEGYTSTKTNFFSDMLLVKALELFFLSLNPDHEQISGTPKDMLITQAAYLTSVGLASSSPGLAIALGLSCSARYGTSAEMVSTIVLPHIVPALLSSNVDKIRTISSHIGIDADNTEADTLLKSFVDEIKKHAETARVPDTLKAVHLDVEQLLITAEDAVSLDFINYIPRPMGSGDIFELLKEAL